MLAMWLCVSTAATSRRIHGGASFDRTCSRCLVPGPHYRRMGSDDAHSAALRLRGGAKTDSEEAKALYALGCNVGRQLGDLTCFKPAELDNLLRGMKAVLTHSELEVDLAAYLPKAAELFKARQEAETAEVVKAGETALAEAAAESGATRTSSGLVIKTLQEGKGEPPSATSKVR